MRNFLIYAPAYTRKYGGVIALHKLCHLINELDGRAFIHPNNVELAEVNALNIADAVRFAQDQVFAYANFSHAEFLGESKLNTPLTHIFNDREYGDDWIVVYPEITFGNPLRAKNVVRWLLHNPGFHSGRINYAPGEFHIRFGDHFEEFKYPGCKLSENFLTVVDMDLDLYNTDGASPDRSGSAYCIRKGWGKPMRHDLTDSVLIDDLTQPEIAQVFKTVQTFYSYDTHTAYSQLAVLCGCDSVVIPDDGVSEDDWSIGAEGRLGLAYGVENLDKARRSAHLVRPYCLQLENRAAEHTSAFMKECDAFFG